MEQLYIICVDDQQEVLNALEHDLAAFDELCQVEVCDSGQEVLDLMEEVDGNGDYIAVIISDQVMPKMSGVTLLAKITNDGRFPETQKMLLTGQATHQDTIEAINLGGIAQYIAKPWERDTIVGMVKTLLTKFIIEKGIEHEPYLAICDQQVLYDNLRRGTS